MTAKTLKVEFAGSLNSTLAGRLDFPEGQPKAFALFAHCFTCSKDIFAASRIAQSLAEHGIAVLRFDFTGLGASEGEFANTNFSSNVEDLLHAASFMREKYEAPQILIGHSLGGAAVLVAAGDIPEVRAVATIGAPADSAHVVHNFGAKIDEIEAQGEADVELAGRPFKIRKQFLDDVREQNVSERAHKLKRALLVFHSPIDQTVGIENAAVIFKSAKHPKSFICLDNADHLLSNRDDAAYVADIIASWAMRYMKISRDMDADDKLLDDIVISAETGAGMFQQQIRTGPHRFFADEPARVGGNETGPSPYDLLSAALGACTSMTLRMYANRKGLELGDIKVSVSHGKVHAIDCEECEGREGRIDRFERTLEIDGGTAPELREKLVEIAGKCPVHRTLEQSSVVVTKVSG